MFVHHFIWILDSNKIRHLRRRKLGEEKKKLFQTIKTYNEQVPEEERIDEDKVESRLSVVGQESGTDSLIWPWELHSGGMEPIYNPLVCIRVHT